MIIDPRFFCKYKLNNYFVQKFDYFFFIIYFTKYFLFAMWIYKQYNDFHLKKFLDLQDLKLFDYYKRISLGKKHELVAISKR